MTLQEVCKILGKSETTLVSSFKRTKENLEKKGIILTKEGYGKKAQFYIEYKDKDIEIIKPKDLIGQRFNRLVILEKIWSDNIKQWKCQCDCGNIAIVRDSNLRNGHTKSCGCLMKEKVKMINYKNEIGNKYGHLTVLREVKNRDKGPHVYWECQCDCNNHTIIVVDGTKLRNGHTRSCGCLAQSNGEIAIETLLKNNNIKYIKEKTFKDLGQYRFDFYINDKYLIEYDGIQHFEATGGWNTKERLQQTQSRDLEKNNFCKSQNIPLIRIPYTHLDGLELNDLLLETTKYRVV